MSQYNLKIIIHLLTVRGLMNIKIVLSFIAFTIMFGAFGQNHSAIDSLKNILKTAKADTVNVNCLNSLSSEYSKISDYKMSMQYAESALVLANTLDYKKGIADSYNNIGGVYWRQGSYQVALEHFLASLKIFEEIGDKVGIAGANLNIGYVYWIQDNYHEANKYLQASLKISEEIGHDNIIVANYNLLGDVNIALNNFQEARKYLDDGLALSKKLGSKLRIMYNYESLLKLDQSEGNFAQALEHYKMYTLYKDSLWNEESNNQIALMKIQYETEKKDREIELLNKDNEIKALQLNQQKVSLQASRLEAEKNQSELLLMNNSMEIQQLKLAETQKNLEQQQAKARVKTVEMELLGKEKILNEQQLEKQKLLRNGMIAVAFLIVLVGLLLFRSFRLRKKLEKQQAIVQERQRISADLHDDVGSGLSRIALLSEMLKTQAKTPENRKEAEKIAGIALELSSNISEIIWALNSNNDYLENMVAYIRRYAAEYFENSPVKLKIITPGKILQTPINGEHRRNIFYTVKEALHNIMKHAQATEAELKFVLINDKLDVIISDNGKGIPDGKINRFGNGINNMRTRMKNISGDFKIVSHHGTKIMLKLTI
jgi:signal transduction histidine kinase